MIYLSLSKNAVHVLVAKKTLLNQFQSAVHSKEFGTNLLEKGKVINVDVVASAIKETLLGLEEKKMIGKEIFLILPQESFLTLRTLIPPDIASSAIEAFLKDKFQTSFRLSLDDFQYVYFSKKINDETVIILYAYPFSELEKLYSIFKLIDLKLVNILPETVGYFTLFEKTLSPTKKENFIYLKFYPSYFQAFLFDSFGYLGESDWYLPVMEEQEKPIREKILEYESKNIKFHRLILSGPKADEVRQDFFTKSVGVWTNPLKKIIANFYQDYLKMLPFDNNQTFPILNYDLLLGAFIFSFNNKEFNFLKKKFDFQPKQNPISFNLPKKEIFIFLGSFLLAFLIFSFLFKEKKQLPSIKLFSLKPTATATPMPTLTPTPTISIKKEEIKIKVLNGSGIAGKAGEVKKILEKAGYSQILTGNADEFNFKITEIHVKKSKAYLKSEIQKILSDYTSSFKEVYLDEKENSDVVIIIGADFK